MFRNRKNSWYDLRDIADNELRYSPLSVQGSHAVCPGTVLD